MSPHRRRLLTSLTALPWLPWLGGCSPRNDLVVASHVWPGYELLFLARSEGWLPKSGVALLETRSASDSLAALDDGLAHGAALTLDEVLLARSFGLPLQVVMVFDLSNGADVVLTRRPLASLAELAGMRIGVETSALGALMLRKTLAAAGLAISDVSVVAATVDGHLPLWAEGDIDAIVTYEPVSSQLEAAGAHRVFDSRSLPDTIFDVLALRPEAVERHAEALRGLIAGHFRALRHLRHNPQDAAYRVAGRLGLVGPQALASFRHLELPDVARNRSLLAAPDGPLVRAAEQLAALMHEHGLVTVRPDLAGLTNDRYLTHEAAP
ncbi:MAG: ABC transporter substrate-binding protein [Rhodocyclaceae bacterium]